jgi:hypothetical protein
MATKESKIAERAYYKYLERGGEHGQDMNDWLEAEQEIKKGKNPVKKSAPKKTSTAKKTTRKSK